MIDFLSRIGQLINQIPVTAIIGIICVIAIVLMIRGKNPGRIWWFIKRVFWLIILVATLNGFVPNWILITAAIVAIVCVLAWKFGDE